MDCFRIGLRCDLRQVFERFVERGAHGMKEGVERAVPSPRTDAVPSALSVLYQRKVIVKLFFVADDSECIIPRFAGTRDQERRMCRGL